MGRVLMIASVDRHLAAFHVPYIELLASMGHTVDVACRVTGAGLGIPGVSKWFDVPIERQPFKRNNIQAYYQIKDIVKHGDYDLLHCHTPVASVLSRIAASPMRKNGLQVMYTAHGFHFFRGAPWINWILYYPVERILAKKTDVLVTINHEDYTRALSFGAGRVLYIPGLGVNVSEYAEHNTDRALIRKGFGVPRDAILVLSVGELNENKNHQIVIRAIAGLSDKNVHYAIAGQGPLLGKLEKLAFTHKVQGNVHFLGFRNDVKDLYQAADIFCFPSRREGLGLAAIEAMSASLPLVASSVHGINDYLFNGINGFSVKPNDRDGFMRSLVQLASDETLRRSMGVQGNTIARKFDLSVVLGKMRQIYLELLTNST